MIKLAEVDLAKEERRSRRKKSAVKGTGRRKGGVSGVASTTTLHVPSTAVPKPPNKVPNTDLNDYTSEVAT